MKQESPVPAEKHTQSRRRQAAPPQNTEVFSDTARRLLPHRDTADSLQAGL